MNVDIVVGTGVILLMVTYAPHVLKLVCFTGIVVGILVGVGVGCC